MAEHADGLGRLLLLLLLLLCSFVSLLAFQDAPFRRLCREGRALVCSADSPDVRPRD